MSNQPMSSRSIAIKKSAAAAVLSIAVLSCGVVKGLPGSSEKAAPSTDQNAASDSKGEEGDPTAVNRIEIAAALAPNPTIIADLSGTTDTRLESGFGVSTAFCSGYSTAAPALIIDAPNGAERLALSAPGVDILFLKLPGGKFFCSQARSASETPQLIAEKLPPGSYEVRGGKVGNNMPMSFSLRIEDPSRPIALPWAEKDVPTIALDGDAREVTLLSRAYAASLSRRAIDERGSCARSSGLVYAETPDVEIKVAKRASLVLGVRAPTTGDMLLIGPMTNDNRDLAHRCLSSWDHPLTLEPGTYLVKLGVRKDSAPAFANFFVRPKDEGALEPTQVATEIADALPVASRALVHHMPFLTIEAVQRSDDLRAALFVAAPAKLLVTPNADMDKSSASAKLEVGAALSDYIEVLRDPSVALAYPRADEPLLLLDEKTALATDGSLFTVRIADLKPAERSVKRRLPESPRNNQLSLDDSKQMAGDDDERALAAHTGNVEDYNKCSDRIWKTVEPALVKLKKYPDVNRARIRKLSAETGVKLRAKCGYAKLKANDEALWAKLEASRTARRANALAAIRARLSK